ncbi:MAG: MFS transporter [Gammaproteobacteria bacterium]|nr:MFS transporter [Gammaproteobacteria bacterium]
MVAQTQINKSLLLFALYLAQGLPFGFFTLALPVILRDAGFSLTQISLLGLLTLPWALKFLWAPIIDGYGTARGWLLGLQVSGVALALALSQLDLDTNFVLLVAAALAFNIIAASQDVVTDGLAVRLLDPKERGIGNGLQVGAYRVGMILGGGALLWLYSQQGWRPAFLAMALLLAVTVAPVLRLDKLPRAATRPVLRTRDLALGWMARLADPTILTAVVLIALYRFGDQMVSSLFGPFLSDTGLDLATIALLKGTVGSATSLAGAALGGVFVFAVGRRRALLAAGLAQSASFALYIAAAMDMGGASLLWIATIVEGIVSTIATVALFTLMMDAAEPDHAGTDYALLASAVVLVGTLAGFAGAALGDAIGYTQTFAAGSALAAAGCLAVVAILDRHAPQRIAAVWR